MRVVGKYRLYAVLGIVGVLTAMSVAPAGAAPNNTIEFIRGYGSDTTYGLMQQLDNAFNGSTGCANFANSGRADGLTSNPDGSCTPPQTIASQRGPENWDHDVAISMYPVGSGNGIVTLDKFATVDSCGGTAGQPYPSGSCGYAAFEYARSSRARGGSDSANLRFVAYAKDAIPWVDWRTGTAAETSGPAAGVSNLSTTQLANIFVNCTLTSWSAAAAGQNVGTGTGADRIIVWAAQDGSGTRKQYDTFVGGTSKNCVDAAYKDGNTTNGERVIFENDASPIVNCATYAGGSCDATDGNNTYLSSMFYFSTGPYAQTPLDAAHGNQHGNGADLGSIGTVAPTSPNIETNAYPFSRLLFNVYRNTYAANNIPVPALDYVGEKGWICKGSVNGSGLPDAVATSGDTDTRGGHITDPLTGRNYATEITGDIEATVAYPFDGLIKNQGFVPLPFGAIGGSVTGNSHCRVS